MYFPQGYPISFHSLGRKLLAAVEYFFGRWFRRSIFVMFFTPRCGLVRYRLAVTRDTPVAAQKWSRMSDFSDLVAERYACLSCLVTSILVATDATPLFILVQRRRTRSKYVRHESGYAINVHKVRRAIDKSQLPP